MSDRMTPIPFGKLLEWMSAELRHSGTIFGIPSVRFFRKRSANDFKIFDSPLDLPLGPGAGPHTQLAQNIVASYLAGGRFIELKTVQQLDRISVTKPCIDAQDEGYNVEWSQELTLAQSYDEYLKAWIAIDLLNAALDLSPTHSGGYLFNMSVGYTLEGIRSDGVDRFIDSLRDASAHPLFETYISIARDAVAKGVLSGLVKDDAGLRRVRERAEAISPQVAASVTLSTMHGCPPAEIESIVRYLIAEKGLHTYVKLNPTLLGFEKVHGILRGLGYAYIELEKESFQKDLQMSDAIPMIERLQKFADQHGKGFGVKLSNTLGVKNSRHLLAGDQMYMSGRALFPLTIALASSISDAFDGRIPISFSGGISEHNIAQVLETGIAPLTLVTDLLKPGGYLRLHQLAEKIEDEKTVMPAGRRFVDPARLASLTKSALTDDYYRKEKREIDSVKVSGNLGKFDCYVAPCAVACPIGQNVPEYVRLVEEERYADALDVIVEKNPLPNITGYICDHQCMNKCTRWDYDNPVEIRELKRVAAERGFDEYMARFRTRQRAKNNLIPVAVIGAGPSGLAAAYFLAKEGFKVTIFDRQAKAGGTVQHVIPEFRLPQEALTRDIEFIQRHGVTLELNSANDLSVAALKQNGFRYIYLAVGAPTPNQFVLAGSNKSILHAVEFLRRVRERIAPELGKSVAVIGGGNSAMDAARAAARMKGVESVYLIYRRTKELMPADREEFDAALKEGALFRDLLTPVSFNERRLRCQRMKLDATGADGRRTVVPIDESFEELEVDTVISAIGEQAERPFFEHNGIPLDSSAKVRVRDESHETLVDNVFVGGDALRGPSTVVEAIADGKKAAESIMRKERLAWAKYSPPGNLFDAEDRLSDLRRVRGDVLPSQPHKPETFAPKIEASRCLGCSFVCDKCVDVCPNRANISIPSPAPDGGLKNISQILHLDALCNECGNCETFCPYTVGSPYKSKTTVFWSETEFLASGNDGFFIERRHHSQNHFAASVRFNGEMGRIVCDASGNILEGSLAGSESRTEFATFVRLVAAVVNDYSYLLGTEA